MEQLPDTLLEATRSFSDPNVCRQFVSAMRWPDGVKCPRCGCERVTFMGSVQRWNCKGCRKQFSVKVGTIFEESPIGLDKWLIAMWLVTNSKNGISSHELARSLGMTQKTAWFVLHRLRFVLQNGSIEKMTGTVEVDETFVGQKAKTMHYDQKQKKIKGRGTSGKTVVMGLLQRGNTQKDENGKYRKPSERVYSQVHTQVVPDTKEETLVPIIEEQVEKGTEVFTDALKSYRVLGEKGFAHAFVDHALRYVEGRVYTNGMENYWGLLDRMMHGTYVYCLPHNLYRYTDELTYRFNHRDGTDLSRFLIAVQQVSGKRLTYEALTQSHLQHLAPLAE